MTSAALEAAAGSRSLSAAAREWVVSLPAGTWFRTAAVPGPRHIAHNVLARLMAAEQPIIGRAARSIYWRQPPPAAHRYGKPPLLTPAADSVLAPPGSCYADIGALSRLGWSAQSPYRTTFAVPYRNLTPPRLDVPGPPLRFKERSNIRRRSLNWNEANLLEAARCARRADYHSWEHAMWLLTEANGWMKQGEPIRKHKVLWAAQTEPPSRGSVLSADDNQAFAEAVAGLSRDLPDVLECP